MGTVYLVGAGPGDPGLLTQRGLSLLRRADCVVYDSLAGPLLLAETKPGCELIHAGKRAGRHAMEQDAINRLLAEKGRQAACVVRLKGGDSFVFGRGGEEGLYLREQGVPFEVVPGVTSAIAGPARAGIPVTHRGMARGFRVMTAHDSGGLANLDFDSLAHTTDTLVFLMGLGLLGEIASRLIGAGMDPQTPAAVIENATLPQQRTVRAALADLERCAREAHVHAPALIVVGRTVSLADRLAPPAPRGLAGARILLPCVGELPSRLGERLRARGAAVEELAVCRVEEKTGAVRREAIESADAVAFTSRRAVQLFFGALFGLGLDARALAGRRIAAVGPGTQEALRAFGLLADCVPPVHTGEALGALLRETLPRGARVLFPRAAGASGALRQALAGWAQVEDPVLYETVPCLSAEAAAAALDGRPFDAAVFTSGSAVRALLGVWKLPEGCRALAIGPKTAARLEACGVTCAEAPHADLEGILEKLEEWFHA